jgi:serine/threonine protein kinase/ankyrin repeat protein
MSELPRCSKCGALLPEDAPAGLCPKCLVQAGFESEVAPEAAASRSDPAVQPTLKSPPGSGGGFEPLAPAELAPLFPQLEILELLGKGGMGAVYKARQRGLDRLVALKILPPEIGHDAAFAERFTREARALARLAHPHIVAVYDFGQTKAFESVLAPRSPDNSLFYIVMEYVDGINLRQTIQTGGLTPDNALAIVPQICEALQFAHDEGIVHRDIKPENILIDKRGRVKIADFGLAKLVGQDARDHFLTGTHQVMGTLRYMAPEQMQGSREVDHRADIYSLGVVFYELLTGELPMGKFAPPSKKVQVDVRLDEIVLRALEQEPEQRYQHASEIKTDVDFIRQSSGVVSKPSALPQASTEEPARAPSSTASTAPAPNRPKLVPVLATVNLLGALLLMLLTAMEDTTMFSESVPRIWQIWGQVDAVLTFVMSAGLFAASVGLFLWKPWARKVTVGVCIFGLASLVFDAPYLARSALPDFYAEIQKSMIAEGVSPDVLDFASFLTFVSLIGGMLLVGLTWLIGQLVYFTRPGVVAAFQSQTESRPQPAITPPTTATAEPHRRIPIAAWIALVPFVILYLAAAAELQQQADTAIARAVAMGSLCFAAVYLSVYAVIALVRRSRRTAEQPSFTEPRPWRIAMFFSLLFFLTALFVGNWVQNPASESAATAPARPTIPDSADVVAAAESSSGWIMGPDGPVLTAAFTQRVLRLHPDRVASVNAALQDVQREYLALEEKNTERQTDAAGHVITTIKPFPGLLAKLEDRLWSRLDLILDSEQQAVARLNLRLHAKPVQPPIALSEIVAPGFFGWGEHPVRVELWQVGAWYHWKVDVRGYGDSSRAPQLPEPYRRFWKEPTADRAASEADPQGDALMLAAAQGQASRVKELLDAGAGVNAKDVDGQTPLMKAVTGGHRSLALTLVMLGADLTEQDKRGQTALMIAVDKGDSTTLKRLSDLSAITNDGADKRQAGLRSFPGVDRTLLAGRDIDLRGIGLYESELLGDENGETASIKAARAGDWECFSLLANHMDSILARDKRRRTVLAHAVLGGRVEKSPEWMEKFHWLTKPPFFGVAGVDNVFVGLMLLFDLERSLSVLDDDGKSALQLAEEQGHKEIAGILRRHLEAIVANQAAEINKGGEAVSNHYRLRGLAWRALGEKEKADADLKK